MGTLGFTTVTFRGLNRRQICELAVKNHIKSIEWGGDVHLPPGDQSALEEVLALQKEFDLQAVSYGSYYKLGDNDQTLWEKITDTAAALGAKVIRIWQGKVSSTLVTTEEYHNMVAETQMLADAAAKKGLIVAFEFHQNTNNDCADAAVRFLQAVGKENVKTYWQPLESEEDLENLKAVLPWLVTVHVFFWDKEYRRYPLSQGSEVWKKYLSVIKEANQNPNYVMEFVKDDDPMQFAEDVKTVKEWLSM